MDIQVEASVDHGVLARLLAVGDADMGRRLHQQIMADLTRLGSALEPGKASNAIAAHEVKGLAVTIGAFRLARMAETLQNSIEAEVPANDLQAGIVAEIVAVLRVLSAPEAGRSAS